MTKDMIQKNALSLSEQERAELASILLASLDPTVDPGAEEAWRKEVCRRAEDLDSGSAKAVPESELFRGMDE